MAATERMARREALPPEELLSREAERGQRVGYAGLAAAILVLAGGIALQAIYADIPRVALIESLREAAGQDIGRTGLLTEKVLFYNDKAVALVIVSLVQAAGVLLTGYVLTHLFDAASGRGASLPRFTRLLAMFGAVATAVGYVALQVVAAILSHDFANSSDHGTKAAHDALRSGVLVAAQFVGFVGTLCLAVAFVLIALNAMRVGLLTRFLGILGMLVGVLLVIPVGSPVPIVQAFWLAAIGVLVLGRWPRGGPPAWDTGRAQPWPSQQEVREQRERARTGAAAPEPDAVAADEPRAETPSPATSRKKKRKRRG
jgi:hypothetical protein